MDIIDFFTKIPNEWQWFQVLDLGLAFILSSLIGLERETKMKSAGLRTHAIVGLAAALLMLVSKYGFVDVLTGDLMRFDPARVAAQIVSGIGFIGGGLIFVRKDIVHGLTTAATVWLTAAIGMACGASLHLLALFACGGYFITMFGYTAIMNRLRGQTSRLLIRYRTGHDAAAAVVALCDAKDFIMLGFAMGPPDPAPETATVALRVRGKFPIKSLAQDLSALPAVLSVTVNPPEE